MNLQMLKAQVTQRDGAVSHMERVYVRGSYIRLAIIPDMLRCVSHARGVRVDAGVGGAGADVGAVLQLCLARARCVSCVRYTRLDHPLTPHRNAPMFKVSSTRGRGIGAARGRATVNRARGGGRAGRG
jgi:hypothetical protein